jgi:hypothetical protein
MDSINTIVTSVPDSNWTLLVELLTGFFVPVLLLAITILFTSLSERRALKHAESLDKENRKDRFSDNAHEAIDRLYRTIQELRNLNWERKEQEDWVHQILVSNDHIMRGPSDLAKTMQQDQIRWSLEKNLTHNAAHRATVVEVVSARSRLVHLVGETVASEVDGVAQAILRKSKKAGNVDDDIMKLFAANINQLIDHVENHLDDFVS